MRMLYLCAALLLFPGTASSTNEVSSGVRNEQICDASTLGVVGQFLGIDGSRFAPVDDASTVVIAAACKKHPESPQIIVAAVAYDSERSDVKATIVALVDETNQKVVASIRDEIVENESMRIDHNSLRIDTAPYTLAPGVRAIGVDLTSSYIPHCVDGGLGAERRLYVPDGERLRPVYVLTMSYWQFVKGGNPRCSSDQSPEDPAVENTELSISIANTITNGYRDLIVTGTTSEDGGDKTSKERSFRYKARYDGREYRDQKR